MKRLFTLAVLIGLMPTSQASAYAGACNDLWRERNQIYADNGYCFKTKRAKKAFGNAGCTPGKPRLSRAERRRVAEIVREEKGRKCR